MKALGEERIADFTSDKHVFSRYKISILTGDYSISPERHRELQDANIIIMTNEMLATRSRMFESEKKRLAKRGLLFVLSTKYTL